MFRKPRLLLLAFALVAGAVLVVLLASTVSRAPVRPPLPNPNGYDDFIKAGEAAEGDTGDFESLDHDSLAALVSSNTEPLRLLRLGLTRQCVTPMDAFRTNIFGSMVVGMAGLAVVLVAEGRLREMENRPAEAALSYVDAIRLGNELSRGAFLTTRRWGTGCEAIGCTPLEKLVPKLNPDDARAVLRDLDKLDAGRVTWAEIEQGERRNLRYQRGNQFNPMMWVMRWWQHRQAMQRVKTRHKQVIARERLLVVELALCCYESEQGHPPARLDELAPKYLSRVPQDPFSGQSLIFRPQGTNWLLHSVGWSKGDSFFDWPL